MVLKSLYNSLSWTNKRRVDKWSAKYNSWKEWFTPKAKKVVSELELPKFQRKEKETTIEKEVESITEIFPKHHNYIGYRLEKHDDGDKIYLIEKPPHPTECTCIDCMDKLGDEIMSRRKVKTDEAE